MKPNTFDDLTRILADPTSRRQALRRISGILGGTALAGLFPGIALAGGGNSDCAHFCNAVFDPGPARGQCKSDAAHGTGLCYTCGPASPNGAQAICCSTNPDGTCTSYSSATCCGSGQTCTNGTCVSAGCPAGTVMLSNGTCATPCVLPNGSCCGGSSCDFDNDGNGYCTTDVQIAIVCSTDSDCPKGTFCSGPASGNLCEDAVVC